MRKFLAILLLAILFSTIAFVFWYTEWKYSLPTPVPNSYRTVNLGTRIDLGGRLGFTGNLPVFLHFFNPDCPCSKFNISNFRSLAKRYAGKIDFAVIVLTRNKAFTGQKIREEFKLTIPVLFDSSLAASCGVYSTPQAVLLNNGQALYYRGNYNRARYCTDQKSNYAQQAIDSLLSDCKRPSFNFFALTAYGCSLPGCKNK